MSLRKQKKEKSQLVTIKKFQPEDLTSRIVGMTVIYLIVSILLLQGMFILDLFTRDMKDVFNLLRKNILEKNEEMTFLVIVFIILVLIGTTSVLMFHEILHYLVCRVFFRVPASFGLGLLDGFIPYLCVSPHHPLKRNHWLVVAITPTIIVNLLLLFLLVTFQEDVLLFSYLMILYFIHFTGCAGDGVLILQVIGHPSSVMIQDEGVVISILAFEFNDD